MSKFGASTWRFIRSQGERNCLTKLCRTQRNANQEPNFSCQGELRKNKPNGEAQFARVSLCKAPNEART